MGLDEGLRLNEDGTFVLRFPGEADADGEGGGEGGDDDDDNDGDESSSAVGTNGSIWCVAITFLCLVACFPDVRTTRLCFDCHCGIPSCFLFIMKWYHHYSFSFGNICSCHGCLKSIIIVF